MKEPDRNLYMSFLWRHPSLLDSHLREYQPIRSSIANINFLLRLFFTWSFVLQCLNGTEYKFLKALRTGKCRPSNRCMCERICCTLLGHQNRNSLNERIISLDRVTPQTLFNINCLRTRKLKLLSLFWTQFGQDRWGSQVVIQVRGNLNKWRGIRSWIVSKLKSYI